MEIGIKREDSYIVDHTNSALEMGSGDLLVLATPSLLAFFENSAKELVRDYLEEGTTTVGISVNMSHLAPTRIGDEVIVTCSLVTIEKRILTFELEARDSFNLISKATHQRCIVNEEKFMSKLR